MPNRFETAAAVARAGGAPPSGTAMLASGRGFADALTAGPIAYGSGLPQLLTEPGALSPAAAAAIADLAITTVVVLGGASAVSSAVESQLQGLGVVVGRLAGATRFATGVAIAEWAVGALGHQRGHVDVATGSNFPDALAGGAHAGASRAVVLLVEPDATGGAAAQYLASHTAIVTSGHAFGGAQAISDASLSALVAAGSGLPSGPVACESALAGAINAERAVAGRAAYTVSAAAGPVARNWSAQMAAAGGLSHNPNIGADLEAAGIHWAAWAENVSFGASADEVHSILMDSAVHRANILDPNLTHMAVGCTIDGLGDHWVTEVFYRT